MFRFYETFDSPWYLLLLALVPLIWILSYRSLSGLGGVRRFIALGLRTLVLVAVVLALAETQWVQRSEKITVMYLLDQSASIPAAPREAMLEYVEREVREHRNAERLDRAGVIIFGREAAIEVPPFDDDVAGLRGIGGVIDLRVDATDLAAALKLAQATFPEDSAKRVVIVTDGNENLGDARAVARALAEQGVGVDVIPVRYETRAEVAVEKVTVPSDVRGGQPFEVRVVVNNFADENDPDGGEVTGRLRLTRRTAEHEETIEQKVTLAPGKRVFNLQQEIQSADFYTYEAQFVPDRPGIDDLMNENNRATAFTHVGGRGHILFIEDWERPETQKGEFDYLVKRLRANNLEITRQSSNQLFGSLAELQKYDAVILANVARSSGGDNDAVTAFSDDQIAMLVRNTQQMGSGLVMIGGPSSFGAGGWSNTELEKAMPIDFHVHNSKVIPVGALAMVMHASEMAQGNYWQKIIGREALKALGPQDYCGVIHWSGSEQWLWGQASGGIIRVGNNQAGMIARLERMTPGDMPDFDPSMRMTATSMARLTDATVRHMIIISDGDPSPPTPGTIQALKTAGVTVSTVAVGTHGPPGSTPLQKIATDTGGKYYVVNDPRFLPRIFQREARRVARPLVYEDAAGFTPAQAYPHEMLQGIEGPFPPITGYVLSSKKDNPLVEVSILSPRPAGDPVNNTILASWTYGIGRTVAFTTDAGHRWATQWTGWSSYDKFYTQMVRWAMRPVDEQGEFSLATDVKEGKVRIIVTALDQDDEFLNFLEMSSSVVGPNMEPFDVKIRQVAPGRYVGEFDGDAAGSYFVNVVPGPGRPPIRTGVNVPYSAEFRDRFANESLLAALAETKPAGGEPGRVIKGTLRPGEVDSLLATNTFRHDLAKAISSQDLWPLLLVIGACVFFNDVLVRRVTISLAWMVPLMVAARDRVLGRQPAAKPDERLERLRSKKAEVVRSVDERRAAARFEPQPDAEVGTDVLTADSAARPGPPRPAARQDDLPEEDADSYTARLLKAKQKVWKDKKKDK
jgi:uncharacterized membrane protein/Mg-chelatase subunit ChlD